MKKLNIGCELDYKEGWVNIDFEKSEITNPDIIVDLNKLPLPFGDNEFDLIQCTEVLEHILYPGSLLKELKRILKTSGDLIVSMPNEMNIYERLKVLFKGYLETFEPEMPHHFHYTGIPQQKELYESLFKIEEIVYKPLEGKKYNLFFPRYYLTNKFPNLFAINMTVGLVKK